MSSHERGLVMSAAQLDELWKFEFELAHELLGLPLRTCSATASQWGTPMKADEYHNLKITIHRMWLRASLCFSAFECEDKGWGLRVNEHSEKPSLNISANSFTIFGWLAVVPVDACPPAHRYLHSPMGENLYLGGPISLANWSDKPSVKCTCSTSTKSSLKSMYYVHTPRALKVGTEITWSYSRSGRHNLYEKKEWYLDECCREKFSSVDQKQTKIVKKPRRVRIVTPYRPCSYCGENLETVADYSSNNGLNEISKRSTKPHIALKHAVQICLDAGLQVDDENGAVTHKAFLSQLHLISRVFNKLESHNYLVKPACSFFSTMGREPPTDNSDDAEKAQCFADFMTESREAFNKYRVVYLRGISIPNSVHDLQPAAFSDYRDIVWHGGKRPRSNTFSVEKLLTEDEKESLEREVKVTVEHIIHEYSRIIVTVPAEL